MRAVLLVFFTVILTACADTPDRPVGEALNTGATRPVPLSASQSPLYIAGPVFGGSTIAGYRTTSRLDGSTVSDGADLTPQGLIALAMAGGP